MKPQHLLILAPILMRAQGFSPSPLRHEKLTNRINAVTTDENLLNLDATLTINHLDELMTLVEPCSILEARRAHEMPWRETIGFSDKTLPLLFMPFWEWQMNYMEENLTNLKCDGSALGDFGLKVNEQKKARITSQCYQSDEYRKIRMTYYDAGDNTQVFNSVWYPDPKYDLPVLGIDLLAFNRKKYLAIVDFQPIHDKEEDHACMYENRIGPIKNQYASLKGRMSSKFYDETQFFSQEMLFARFEDEDIVFKDLFPAFKRYVMMHNKIMRETIPNCSIEEHVLNCQKDYDSYSADRDPATALFAAMFGKQWADEFVFDFLFSMSERKEEASSTRR